jgi:ABC-2 type transport system permease protein
MNRVAGLGVFGKWLWDARRGLFGWTLAIVLVGGAYAAFWPLIDDPELMKLLESYPQAMLEALNYTNITTPAGYLDATVYGLLAALLLLVYGVSAGTRIIAGDEEAGTLELELAHPVSRTGLALKRFAAFTVSVGLILGAFWIAMTVLIGPARLEGITPANLAAMHVHVGAFALMFGAISYGVGAASGRRALGLGVGAAAGVLAYAMRGLIPQVPGLEWVADWSAFTWLNGSRPLENGLHLQHLGIMLGTTAVLVALGTWGFTRRDVAA